MDWLKLEDLIGPLRAAQLESEKKSVRLVYAVVCSAANCLLVTKLKGLKYWLLPGGLAEDNESIEQATRRIVLAQTGFKLGLVNSNTESLNANRNLYRPGGLAISTQIVVYSTRLMGGYASSSPKGEEITDSEVMDVAWINFREINVGLMPVAIRTPVENVVRGR